MVKIFLLYLTLVSCGYIIKVVPEPPPRVQHKHPQKMVNDTPEIDKHEPVIEEIEPKKKPLVPQPPKG